MSGRKSRHHKKMHGGLDFKSLFKKGLDIAKKVKDSGLISKGLNAASGIASAFGKNDIADKLGTAQGFAEAVGAGRKRKSYHIKAPKKFDGRKLTNYKAKSPTIRAEISQMDGSNMEPSGRIRKMHGGAWYDDLWSGIKTVASTALPIALQAAPMLMGAGRHHRGGALNLAGRGLSMAGGSGYHHNHNTPNYIHHGKTVHRLSHPSLVGSGSLGRVRRGHAVMILH